MNQNKPFNREIAFRPVVCRSSVVNLGVLFLASCALGDFISCWSDCAIQYHSKESHSSGSDTDAVSSISDVCYAVIEHHFKSRSGRIKECEFAVFLGTRVSCLSVSS